MQGTLQEAFHCIRSSGGGTECGIALAAEQPYALDTPAQLPFGERGGYPESFAQPPRRRVYSTVKHVRMDACVKFKK